MGHYKFDFWADVLIAVLLSRITYLQCETSEFPTDFFLNIKRHLNLTTNIRAFKPSHTLQFSQGPLSCWYTSGKRIPRHVNVWQSVSICHATYGKWAIKITAFTGRLIYRKYFGQISTMKPVVLGDKPSYKMRTQTVTKLKLVNALRQLRS
ncbi:hypothetical protein F8M41_007543 [Gigaspora margarita]|uniref:LAGLIDADG endonuclease n=1 Tax=Gigaspora margarita TaxID=4874 RepID=A0A8H3X5L0_GIGMA|nr:hypothetical protein F8M41_007543 [Gigaspora margarita]